LNPGALTAVLQTEGELAMKIANRTLVVVATAALVWACQSEANAGGTVLKSEDNFKASAEALPEKPGALNGKLAITLETLKEWHMSHEAPWVIELKGPEEVKLSNLKLRNKDMVTPKAAKPRFEVAWQVPAKGTYELKLKFDVVICTDKMCQKKRFEAPFSLVAGPAS
jgi:hypothetical protein